jgi:hypothetical protein
MSTYQAKDIPGKDTRYRKYMELASNALLQALYREHPKILHTLKQKERSNAR